MHAVIFSGGNFSDTPLSRKAIKDANIIITADKGADAAIKIGIMPHVIIGDFDSVSKNTQEKLKKGHVEFVQFKEEKDETDTELAVLHAQKLGATKITILAGIEGDRIDHILANILLATISDIPLIFIQNNQEAFVVKGPSEFQLFGNKGDLLSLIPLVSDVGGITTKNLQYALENGTLFFGKPRGVSNVFMKKEVGITIKQGVLFVVHTTMLTS